MCSFLSKFIPTIILGVRDRDKYFENVLASGVDYSNDLVFTEELRDSWGSGAVSDIERYRSTVAAIRSDVNFKGPRDSIPDFPTDYRTLMYLSIDPTSKSLLPHLPVSWENIYDEIVLETEILRKFENLINVKYVC